MKPDNLHQTLVFLGHAAPAKMTDVGGLAANLGIHGFDLEFGVTGYWRHNRIAWAAPHATPEPLRCLVAALQRGSQQAGVRVDERPYASHVTLIRDARAPAALPPLALTWRVADFALTKFPRWTCWWF